VFARRVLVLAGGTAIAQVVRTAGTPILTRIFLPQDYGVLAVFSSMVAVLLPISSLRYELAIPLPEEDDVASHLLVISLIAAVAFAAVVGSVSLILDRWIAVVLGAPTLQSYMWLLPLSVIGASGYSIFSYWAVRREAFASIARTQLAQSVSQLVTQVGIGIATVGPFGLLVGDVVGRAAGTGTLAGLATTRRVFDNISLSGLRRAAKRYVRFPLLSSPSAAINAVGFNAPTLLLASFYGTQTVGWFALAQRVIGVPSTLVGQSVSQVYFAEAARLARVDTAALYRLFWRMTVKLFLLALIPTAVLCTFGPWLFSHLFGEYWLTAGHYVRLLAPMFLVQFAVVPVSMTANILERQDIQLVWDVCRLAVVAGTMILAGMKSISAYYVVLTYSVTMLVSYVVLLYLLDRVLRHRRVRPPAMATLQEVLSGARPPA
jgi:O-antigen/teichoic acid export membrane protein